MSGHSHGDWRINVLDKAYQRFEQGLIQPTIADIAVARKKLSKEMASVSGKDAAIRKLMLNSELKQLNAMEARTKSLLSFAKGEFKNHLAGKGKTIDQLVKNIS